MGDKHIFKFYCCLAVLLYIIIHCCIPMSKPTENDVHLWIGDMLPIIYEAALIIFHYSKKGEVPYGRQSLISMQRLYMIIS